MRRLIIRQVHTLKLRFSSTSASRPQPSSEEDSLNDVLHRLEQGTTELDAFTCVRLIRGCASAGALKTLSSYISQSDLREIIYIQECLVHAYIKSGSFEEAKLVFDKLHQRSKDVTTWTTILGAFSRRTKLDRVFKLYNEMIQAGVKPDMYTFTTMLSACVSGRGLREGRMIHLQISELGCDVDLIIATSIISMYGKCGSLEEARTCFDGAVLQDVTTWNTMVSTYVQHGRFQDSFQLFSLMLLAGVMPNKITFVTVLNGCNSPSALEVGKRINSCISELGQESDVILGTALLNMFAKCGSVQEACGMFSKIESPDIVSWNSLLSAQLRTGDAAGNALYRHLLLHGVAPNDITFITALNGCTRPEHLQEGLALHRCLSELGLEASLFIRNALIDMFGKCGELRSAEAIFKKNEVENSVVTWSVMISAYTQNGEAERGVRLFKPLLCEGLPLDCVVFINLLNASAAMKNLSEGKLLHRLAADIGLDSDLVLATAVINMYVKCSSLELAREVFEGMKQRNAVSWNTMISGYTRGDRPREALVLFQRMDPELADETSFVAALDACASLAAIAEGRAIHRRVIQRRIPCDLVLRSALLNMYGKCGCLEEARRVFDEMAGVDTILWNSMLAAYAQVGFISEVLRLFSRMKQEGVRPDSVTFVSVLCACSHAGSLEMGGEYFVTMLVEHGIAATAEHYGCLLDLLSRLGMLEEAEYVIGKVAGGDVEWNTLLAACRTQRDPDRARNAAGCLMGLKPRSSIAYVVLSSINSDI